MTATITEERRVCEQCFESKPLSEFRCKKRGTSLRARECRTCHNETERLRQAEKRAKATDLAFAQFHAQLKRTRDEKRVAILVAVMVESFGGLHEFVAAWIGHIDQAMEKSPGSKKVLDFFQAITQMSDAAHKYHKPPDPAEMTTENLTFALRQQLRDLVRDEPELAVAAARELGWEVRPSVPTASD